MSEPDNRARAAAQARLAAAILSLGRSVDLWSLALTALALCALLWAPVGTAARAALIVAALAGGIQKIFALRVALDRQVFEWWADDWIADVSADKPRSPVQTSLSAFDRAAVDIGLRPAPTGPVRDLDSRVKGARRLAVRQGLAFAVQFASWLCAGVMVILT